MIEKCEHKFSGQGYILKLNDTYQDENKTIIISDKIGIKKCGRCKKLFYKVLSKEKIEPME